MLTVYLYTLLFSNNIFFHDFSNILLFLLLFVHIPDRLPAGTFFLCAV